MPGFVYGYRTRTETGEIYQGDTRTARQKEQQKLFHQSGTLHRLRMNLLVICEDTSLMLTGEQRLKIMDAVSVVTAAIETNREAFATIKQRIKADKE